MKSLHQLIFILLSLAVVSCNTNLNSQEKFSVVEDNFQNPQKTYRTAPFWVWNTKMTKSHADSMLLDFKNAGCGGVFVHPRPGMITEYLSEEWFDMYEYTIKKAEELDLDVWIYDENSYPSGFAGGNTIKELPSCESKSLSERRSEYLPDKCDEYELILMSDSGSFVDITSKADQYKGVKADYYLYTIYKSTPAKWMAWSPYVDLIGDSVTETFIDVTMRGYEKRFSNLFGDRIKGVFTDEPQIESPGITSGPRWTNRLFEVFEQRHGYDLKLNLPSLSSDIGNWKKIRHDYFETLLWMFMERWSKPWSSYCEKNNLQWTGHYWECSWPRMDLGQDHMAMYQWHQMPGIDKLFNQFNEDGVGAQYGDIRPVKELRSAASQTGKRRTLCESFGGAGWDVSFKELKRLSDWTFVHGVNFINQHLAHSSIEGCRKYDYPPEFTYHSPWWGSYRYLNDHHARLSLSLSHGEQRNKVLVLEPTTTMWTMYRHNVGFSYTMTHATNKFIEWGNSFHNFVTSLSKKQVEFDLGSETIFKNYSTPTEGKFIVGERDYSAVVIPPSMKNIEKHTFELLKAFAAKGGMIIAFDTLQMVDGEQNDELAKFILSDKITKYDSIDNKVIDKLLSYNAVSSQFTGDGNPFYHHRYYKDGEMVFVVNSSLDKPISGKLRVKGKSLRELDTFTGNIYDYPSTNNDGYNEVDINLPPAGSVLLFSSYNRKRYPENPSRGVVYNNIAQPLSDTKVKREAENALNIDFCDINISGKEYKDVYFWSACDLMYRHYGYEGNPWNSVQYKQTTCDGDTLSGNITVTYHFETIDPDKCGSMNLVIEHPELWKVSVNGKLLDKIPEKWWLDRSFGVYQIPREIVSEKNSVVLHRDKMSIYNEIEPIYIIGDFDVVGNKANRWSIAPESEMNLGSWRKQGKPFYSNVVTYSKNYLISDTTKRYCVEIGEWSGTVAKVLVNDVYAGLIISENSTLDITPYINKGENRVILQVTGSHKNLLGPFYTNEVGIAHPFCWYGNRKLSIIDEYLTDDYGLFEDITVKFSDI